MQTSEEERSPSNKLTQPDNQTYPYSTRQSDKKKTTTPNQQTNTADTCDKRQQTTHTKAYKETCIKKIHKNRDKETYTQTKKNEKVPTIDDRKQGHRQRQ